MDYNFENMMKLGIPEVINYYGEHRKTKINSEGLPSIVFKNGLVASIVKEGEGYSVAMCDWNGYFDWNILSPFDSSHDGSVYCETEEEACFIADIIRHVKGRIPGLAMNEC